MFCHQCQETMKNTGCNMKQGMCGKSAEVANLQDLFIWGLKGIPRVLDAGQCNDSYSLAVIAMELRKAFQLGPDPIF